MKKNCDNCGAPINGEYCAHCGTNTRIAKSNPTSNTETKAANINMFGLDFGKFTSALTSAISVQQRYNENGQMSEEDLAQLNSCFGMGEVLEGVNKFNTDMAEKIKAKEESDKRARTAIHNQKCPSCSTPFNKNQSSCKKCGAILDISNYESY